MKNSKLKLIGAAALSLILVAIVAPSAHTAPNVVTLTASVQDQNCLGGDFVDVTLTATLQPPQTGVRYSWDFDNDGVFDTQPSTNPTVTHQYLDETSVTARVRVTKGRKSAEDTVTFGTLNCH